jgi:hypothetical protein
MSPFIPHGCAADVVKPVPDCKTYHTPVDGRQMATAVLPSPSKSPGTGMSPARPR